MELESLGWRWEGQCKRVVHCQCCSSCTHCTGLRNPAGWCSRQADRGRSSTMVVGNPAASTGVVQEPMLATGTSGLDSSCAAVAALMFSCAHTSGRPTSAAAAMRAAPPVRSFTLAREAAGMIPELARAPTAAQASTHAKRIHIIYKLAVADQRNERLLARTVSGTAQGGSGRVDQHPGPSTPHAA